jgi:1,2-diacylglycerol 3-alpha-glucosyltransferase
MRVCVIWSRIGPYHLARLAAAGAELGSMGMSLIAIEVAAQDEYLWQRVGNKPSLDRTTLFPSGQYANLSGQAIRRAVAGFLRERRPSVVVVNGWSMPEARAALGWTCVHRSGSAVVMSETKADDAPRRWWRELPKRAAVSCAQAGLVGGRRQAEYLSSLGMPRERIALGYDAVDNDYFARGAACARAARDAMRSRFNLPARYFFACTRFLPRKNVDGLIRAYARYRENAIGNGTHDPWELVIAGAGSEDRHLRDLAAAVGVEGVRWAGFVQYEDLPTYYGLAACFVHPAHSEAWGLVVNEAAASGLPLLIADRVGARHELLTEGQNGWTFDSTSTESMTQVLERMAALDEGARLRMGECSTLIVADWGPARFASGLRFAVETALRARGLRS